MKVGDKVKIISDRYVNEKLSNGQTGVIVCMDFLKLDMMEVAMDNGYCNPLDDPSWPFAPNELEVI